MKSYPIFKKTILLSFILSIVVGFFLSVSFSQGKNSLISQHLKSEANQFKTVIRSDSKDEESRRKNVVKNLYSWVQEEISRAAIKDFIKSTQDSISIMPNWNKITWKQRLKLQTEKRDEPIVINSRYWKSDHNELLIVQFDYQSYLLNKRGYLMSTPPRIYYKSNNELITTDLSTWKYAELGSITYTIHGFISTNIGGSLPDILISTGPVGSGNYVYFVQMHYDNKSHNWKQIWETGFAHVTDIKFSEDNGELVITYLTNKFSRVIKKSNYKLIWGGYLK